MDASHGPTISSRSRWRLGSSKRRTTALRRRRCAGQRSSGSSTNSPSAHQCPSYLRHRGRPVSTDLWRYERALEEAGLPFASQAGKNLFRRQEAQDLVALVRALADPRDTLALGALLRGPLVGLTEHELLSITEKLPALDGGAEFARLSLQVDPTTIEHDVAREILTSPTRMKKISFSGYRFPAEIIRQAIWLHLRFTLGLR